MDEDKRATALNSISTVGKVYISLSDGTKIGKKVLKDLKKLMELELREKYKIVKNKWKVVSSEDKEKTTQLLAKKRYKEVVEDKLIKRICDKYKSNKAKADKIITKQIHARTGLLNSKSIDPDDDNLLNELKKKKQEMEELVEIDYITKETISFNSIIVDTNDNNYFLPYVVINDDPKDIAVIINDKKELDKIFREKHFKSFDDSVILEFYNEITTKLSNTKDLIRKTDVNIRKEIIEDLYKKLFAIYDIKEHNLKDKDNYTKQIKENYINNKIIQNNTLSFTRGGGPFTAIRKLASKGFSRNHDKSFTAGDQFVQSVLVNVTATGTDTSGSSDTPSTANKGTTPVDTSATQDPNSLSSNSRASLDAKDPINAITTNKGTTPVDTSATQDPNSLSSNSRASLDAKDPINIDLLNTLVSVLEKNSRYKKDIQALIEFNQAISNASENAKTDDKNKQSEDKRVASNTFIKKAFEKYKKLKKSFIKKVATDKKALDKQMQEGAEKNFIKDTTFNNIVDADDIYIENVKGLYSYLQHIDVERKGGAPLYDIKKTENPENKEAGTSKYDFYKILKGNYIEIVNQYYKLIDEIGKEEDHYKFIYEYESLGIKDENNNKPASISGLVDTNDNPSIKSVKEAYKFISDKLKEAIAIDNKKGVQANLFVHERDQVPPLTRDIIRSLAIDMVTPNKKTTIKYKKENKTNNWKKAEGKGSVTQTLFNSLDGALTTIDEQCVNPDNGCDNILSIVKEIFNDTSTMGENESKLNELNEKIQLVEGRIKLLDEVILKLPKEFEKLYKVMKTMKGLSQATEYEEFVINILKRDKIEFFEKDKDDKEKHPIIKALNNEKDERENQLKKLKNQREEAKAAIEDDNAIKKADFIRSIPNIDNRRKGNHGGGSKDEKYKTELKLDTDFLKDNYYKTFTSFITCDNTIRDNNLHILMKNLKDDVEYLENNDDANNGSDKSYDVGREKGIYEDIWSDYNFAVGKKDNKQERWKNNLLYLTEGEKLHERVIQNDLDPEIVLKINFRDKAIYIFLIFLIRTINIITLEFLIEYNLIQSLQYAIVFYGFMYLVIIIFLIAIVNYDSYKLRIIFNYLNIHINSPNLLVQNVLFIIFIILVYILVKSDDFLKYFGDLLDYTNIYNNIYNYTNSLDDDYYTNLTQNEKLKLLYRIDIISMIIFIFSAFLVLIL